MSLSKPLGAMVITETFITLMLYKNNIFETLYFQYSNKSCTNKSSDDQLEFRQLKVLLQIHNHCEFYLHFIQCHDGGMTVRQWFIVSLTPVATQWRHKEKEKVRYQYGYFMVGTMEEYAWPQNNITPKPASVLLEQYWLGNIKPQTSFQINSKCFQKVTIKFLKFSINGIFY